MEGNALPPLVPDAPCRMIVSMKQALLECIDQQDMKGADALMSVIEGVQKGQVFHVTPGYEDQVEFVPVQRIFSAAETSLAGLKPPKKHSKRQNKKQAQRKDVPPAVDEDFAEDNEKFGKVAPHIAAIRKKHKHIFKLIERVSKVHSVMESMYSADTLYRSVEVCQIFSGHTVVDKQELQTLDSLAGKCVVRLNDVLNALKRQCLDDEDIQGTDPRVTRLAIKYDDHLLRLHRTVVQGRFELDSVLKNTLSASEKVISIMSGLRPIPANVTEKQVDEVIQHCISVLSNAVRLNKKAGNTKP
jgi:hypothetical protein